MGTPLRIFHYSLDWRFLLPVADIKKLSLLLEEDEDFRQTLEQVGIDPSQRLSFSDLKQKKSSEAHSFVLPFGMPVPWVGRNYEDQVAFYFSIRRLMAPGGYLLIGFNNIWNLRAQVQTKYYSSTPHRMADQLKQAGFQSIKLFGAMPNLAIPEYIFDLTPQTIQFALQNRFRRKPAVLHALRVLSLTPGLKRISNLLPCYFVVASA